MGTNNLVFLEVIEWFDETGREMLHRIPESGSGEIKFGAQLIVRESQAAVFFYNGRAFDAFGPGRHTLKTANIPILTKVLSAPWGMTSPLRAEVYFANLKVFTNLKWGTRDPVAFKDSELGLIRLRAFGVFNVRIMQPVLFINSLAGTQGIYSTEGVEEYLNRVIVSRLNDYLGENLDTFLKLPGRYEEIADGLTKRLREDFSRFGLGLSGLYINSITPPPDVQKAIDDKSKLGIFDDLNSLLKMKAAMSIEKAAENQGETGSAMGMGLGIMMPAMFAEALKGAALPSGHETFPCPECGNPNERNAKFCPNCGHQVLVFSRCSGCGKNLLPTAKFCSRCGRPVEQAQENKQCSHCSTENLPESVFCNHCGEKL